MRLLSQLYAFMYWSKRNSFLGFALSAWIRVLPVGLFLVGLVQEWPVIVNGLWVALFVVLVLLYAAGRRAGYKRFIPEPHMALDDDFAVPQHEQRVPLRATGLFSVQDREEYVLERPGAYWRVPLGQHVFMVEEGPGRFLYQIIDPRHVKIVEPGYLLFGRHPQKALALRFTVSWGPQFATEPVYYYTPEPDDAEVDGEMRTVFFTFDHDADRYAVWKSLLEEGQHETDIEP
jgi:hypothetical protein